MQELLGGAADMGHDMVQREGLGAGTFNLLLKPLPGWPFYSSCFFSASPSPLLVLLPQLLIQFSPQHGTLGRAGS